MKLKGSYTWPKQLPDLTPEQIEVKDDFMKWWHEQLASKKSFVPLEKFNHGYTVRNSQPDFVRTLEIGAGLGEHLEFENLSEEQRRNYIPVELRSNMVQQIRERFPDINAHQGDCQGRLDFDDSYFDRIIAIHVLEHLPNLPAAVKEMYRLCNKEHGIFSVVIPCEGGMAYNLARYISTEQMFRKRYGQPYKWFIDSEHISIPAEITKEVERYFEPVHKEYFPFMVPVTDINLIIGITYKPRKTAPV